MKKYDNYKDSGVEWIGEIPEHWNINRLRNIADSIKTGSTPPSEEIQYFEPKDINWYGPGDFDDLILYDAKRKISNLSIKENKCRLFPPNSILLIGIGATVGKVGIVSEASTSNQQINAIILKNEYNPKYYTYFISTIKDIIVMEASSATLPIFNQTQTKNIVLPVPEIFEQTTIANYLDRKTTQIDTLITKKEQFISLLQEERTAVINQAVTKGLDPKVKMKDSGIEWLGEIPEHWEVTRLGFLSSKIGDGLHGTPNYVDNSDFKFINGNNIGNGQISIYEHTKCVSEDEYIFNKKELNQNSILMSINGTIGNLGFYKGEKVMLGKSVAYINIIDSKALNFTYKYLESESCKTYIDNQLSGSTIKNLSLYSINKIPIPFPSFDEQKEIVDFITIKTNEIDILISKSQQKIELLKEYKTALISEVVTGKVDVRDVILN